MQRITVLLAEQEEVVRRGIRRILGSSDRLDVVAEVSDTAGAVGQAKLYRPHVALIAAGLPAGGAMAAADRIKRVSPETRVLLMAWEAEEDPLRRQAAAAGHAFLLKTCSDRELVEVVKRLGAGADPRGTPAMPRALRTGPAGEPRPVPLSDLDLLTAREREVLALIARGKTNREIGVALGISATTADSHRKHIMEKLGIHSKTDLVRFALVKGLDQ